MSTTVANGVLTIAGTAGRTNDLQAWISPDRSVVWASDNGVVTTVKTNAFTSIQIVKGSDSDKISYDTNKYCTTTVVPPTGNTAPSTSNPGGTWQSAGVSVSNGTLTVTGASGQTNDLQVWLSPDRTVAWASVNGTVKTISTSTFWSVNIVKGSASDKVSYDINKYCTTTVSAPGVPSSGNDTGGGTTTNPGTTTQSAGVSVSNGVLVIQGASWQTNDLQAWVSPDRSVVWAAVNGTVKTVPTSSFTSVQIVKGSDSDKVSYDTNKYYTTTVSAPGTGTSTGGGGTTTPNTGGSQQQAGIAINNGVLTLTGASGQTNDLQAWVSPDRTVVWATVNGTVKTISTSSFTSIQIVKGSDSDKVSYDTNKYCTTTVVAAGTGSTNTGGGNTTTPTTPTTPSTPPSTPDSGNWSSGTWNNGGSLPYAVISMVSPTSILAGQPINANGVNSALNAGSPITARYEWDFGDSGSRFNTMVGYNAAHIYDRPGTYTLKLKVTNENGQSSTTTQTIYVAADNRPTVYVDAYGGNDGNNGSSPNQAIRSVARANQLMRSGVKVLFKRGQTFDVASGLTPWFKDVTIGAYGDGANPLLRWTGPLKAGMNFISGSAAETKNLVIENLQFDSNVTPQDWMPDGFNAFGTNLAVRNCTFIRAGDAVNANGRPSGLLVQDNAAPNANSLWAYFVWLEGSDAVIVGNTVKNSMRQHDIRAADGFARALIADNDLTNLDLRNAGDSGDFSKTTLNIQDGSYVYVRGNHITDGAIRVGPLGGADGIKVPGALEMRTKYAVLESNTIDHADIELVHGAESTMIRNNVIRFDNEAAIQTEAPDPAFNNRQIVDLRIVNNTAINNGANGNFLWVNGQGSGWVLDNNLYVAPNMAVGGYQTAPVFVRIGSLSMFKEINGNVWQTPKSSGWGVNGGVNVVSDSGDLGYKTPDWWNNQYMVGNDTFSNTAIGSDFRPASYATAATYARRVAGVLVDFYGNARPSDVWSAGAVQA